MGIAEQIDTLIKGTPDDRELAVKLTELSSTSWEVGGTVGTWGPRLYARNRTVFVPIIERFVTGWSLRECRDLESWMNEADENGDLRLFRGLYEAWLNKKYGWGKMQGRWRSDFIIAFQNAPDRGSRRDVVEKYGLWFDIEDDFALELYQTDPVVARDFLTKRLARLDWHEFVYEETAKCALEAGDTEFYFELYRLTFTTKMWEKDALRLMNEAPDAATLCHELTQRHLGLDDNTVDIGTLCTLLEHRGADVVPYLEANVGRIRSWRSDDGWSRLAELAREGGWHKLWSVIIQTQYQPPMFTAEVDRLVMSAAPDWEILARLSQIAGAKSGWWTWRSVMALDEALSVRLYKRFPQICRGAFSAHFVVTPQSAYEELAKVASAAGDEDFVDVLAARAAMATPGWYGKTEITNLQWYIDHYTALDAVSYARRAVNVIGQTAEPEKYFVKRIRRDNPVHHMFFDNVARLQPALPLVRDLLEAASEPARYVGLRMIADAGADGVDIAVRNADHLVAYLLNEAPRRSRLAAFEALTVAVHHSRIIADDVLSRARAALDLRRNVYPREHLIALIGAILYQWPALRSESEHPVVFGAEATW